MLFRYGVPRDDMFEKAMRGITKDDMMLRIGWVLVQSWYTERIQRVQ